MHKLLSFTRHQCPSDVTRHAVRRDIRFTLSLLDVVELLVERGDEVSYETVRCWIVKFGPPLLARRQWLFPLRAAS